MSTKALVWGIVVIAIVLGGWYWWSTTQNASTAPSPAQTTAGTQQSNDGTLSSGTSDTELNADLNSMDTQLQGASSDSASVDQSFNDQPVQQTE